MSREVPIWDWEMPEARPDIDPVLVFHDTPHYPGDPGTGVEFRVEGDEVFVSMFWDGDERFVIAFTREEFRVV